MDQVIGRVTTYKGTEHRYLSGRKVRIVAVTKGAARPGGEDCAYLTDDADIARAGGVTADDRVEVQPWIEDEGRFSFATSDPLAVDLECFAGVGAGG